jgi:hypothetical protein
MPTAQCPPPFTISAITYKVVMYAPAERADTLPLFLLYPYMYSVAVADKPDKVQIQTDVISVLKRETQFLSKEICKPT